MNETLAKQITSCEHALAALKHRLAEVKSLKHSAAAKASEQLGKVLLILTKLGATKYGADS